jgi:hypothetical protein
MVVQGASSAPAPRLVSFGSRAQARACTQRGWLLCIARVVALLMMLELSGAAHLALDGYELLSGEQHQQGHEDCEDEQSGRECPPGCLNCHCAHAAVVAVAPCLEATYRALHGPERVAPPRARALGHPVTSERDSIYRPPRLHA